MILPVVRVVPGSGADTVLSLKVPKTFLGEFDQTMILRKTCPLGIPENHFLDRVCHDRAEGPKLPSFASARSASLAATDRRIFPVRVSCLEAGRRSDEEQTKKGEDNCEYRVFHFSGMGFYCGTSELFYALFGIAINVVQCVVSDGRRFVQLVQTRNGIKIHYLRFGRAKLIVREKNYVSRRRLTLHVL